MATGASWVSPTLPNYASSQRHFVPASLKFLHQLDSEGEGNPPHLIWRGCVREFVCDGQQQLAQTGGHSLYGFPLTLSVLRPDARLWESSGIMQAIGRGNRWCGSIKPDWWPVSRRGNGQELGLQQQQWRSQLSSWGGLTVFPCEGGHSQFIIQGGAMCPRGFWSQAAWLGRIWPPSWRSWPALLWVVPFPQLARFTTVTKGMLLFLISKLPFLKSSSQLFK